jgi:hypothetical protein
LRPRQQFEPLRQTRTYMPLHTDRDETGLGTRCIFDWPGGG